MSAEAVVSRLERVKQTGQGRCIARCPAHQDKAPSLSVRELDDGRVLLHCFAGCSVHEVLNAIGLTFDDLFPEKLGGLEGFKRERRPFFATDVLRAISTEVRILSVAAYDLGHGRYPSKEDRERLLVVAERLQSSVELALGN